VKQCKEMNMNKGTMLERKPWDSTHLNWRL